MTARCARPRRVAIAACLPFVLAMAACQQQPAATIPAVPIKVVDVGRAVQAFSDICLDTAPDFTGARQRFAAHGLTDRRDEGIVYDASGTLSVHIDDLETSRGRRLRCSVVYEDPNRTIAEERIDDMVRAFPSQMRGQRRARFPASRDGVREGRAWRFAAGGRTGELLDVPHAGRTDLGVLILQFPSRP